MSYDEVTAKLIRENRDVQAQLTECQRDHDTLYALGIAMEKNRDELQAKLTECQRARERDAIHIEVMSRSLDGWEMRKRAEKAEAERDRLRATIESAKTHLERHPIGVVPLVLSVLEKALAEVKP